MVDHTSRPVRWPLLAIPALTLALFTASCGSQSTPSTAEFETKPVPAGDHALGITIDVRDGDNTRPVIVDTGSIYYFKGAISGEVGPTCAGPESFTYGVGVARFCPSSESVDARTSGDGFAPIVNHPLSMGIATFSNWEPGIPNAVLGLAGNMEGTNRSGLSPTIQQISPAHLSFRFPNGGLANGAMSFDELPDQRAAGVPQIPLVSPGSLGYGYTANVRRMEFLAQGAIASSILFEPGGVYLDDGSKRDRIADRHLAFFDTGTPLPIVFSNGDVSLLGDNVTAGDIGTRTTGRRYDQVRVVFDDLNGSPVTISTSNLAPFMNNNPSALVPTKAEFPAGMKMLATVVGYPILSEYDVQIDFDNGSAKTIRFASR